MLFTNDKLKAYYNWRTMFLRTYQDGLYVAKNSRSQYDSQECSSYELGMGMLAAVICGQRADFDGLFRYYKRFRNKNGLMGFCQTMGKNGKFSPKSHWGGFSRTEADVDIATSLFLAKNKWNYDGQQGQVDYGAEATDLAQCIWERCFNQETYMPLIGDYAKKVPNRCKLVRPGHFILGGYWVLQQEDTERSQQWGQVIERIIIVLQEQLALHPKTGLLANHLTLNSKGHYIPVTGKEPDLENGHLYGIYSCKSPWRLSHYYALNGDTRVKAILEAQAQFFETELAKGGIDDGYLLDGQRTGVPRYQKSFAAPVGLLFGTLGWNVPYNSISEHLNDAVLSNDSAEYTIELICALQHNGKAGIVG